MSEPTRSWKNVRGDQPVNEARARVYEQLMEAQERIAQAQYRSGVSHEAVSAALDAADERLSDEERREDLYISALTHFAAALGGRLEVRALIGNEVIVVRREPSGKMGP